MIDLPYQSFLSGANFTAFLSDVKWLLFFVAPIILIFVASDLLIHLVNVVKGLFIQETKSKDDDYDIEHY